MVKTRVVDDSSEDLEVMKSLLEKEGHEVVTVTDGAQALDGFDRRWI
jgi:CheY-like chemotaxis protein